MMSTDSRQQELRHDIESRSLNPWLNDSSRHIGPAAPEPEQPVTQASAPNKAQPERVQSPEMAEPAPAPEAPLADQVALAQRAADQAVMAQQAAERAAQQAQRTVAQGSGGNRGVGGAAWRMILADARRYLVSVPFLILLPISILLNVAALAGTASTQLEDVTKETLDATAFTHSMIGLAFGGSTLLAMVFGALTITRDFGNRFIVRESFLAGGVEGLARSKLASIFLPLFVFGLSSPFTALIFVAIRLNEFDEGPEFDKKTWQILIGLVFAAVGTGYFGHFVGWLIRNPIISIVTLMAWTLLLEGYMITLLERFVERKSQFLPGGALQTLLRDTSSIEDLYPVWAGYLIYLGWLAVLGIGVALRIRRTDLV